MRRAELKPGQYYRAKLGRGTDAVRFEGFAEPRYEGDIHVGRATRFLVKGAFVIPVALRNLIEPFEPSESLLRINAKCEEITRKNERTS